MGMALNQLAPMLLGDILDSEHAGLGGQIGMKQNLEQQVAQLLLQFEVGPYVDLAGWSFRRKPADHLDDLVRLLNQVADQAVMSLLGVPWTLGPQPATHLDQTRPSNHAGVDKHAGA